MIWVKKKKYYQNLLTNQKGHMRNTWRTLNSLLGKAKKNNQHKALRSMGHFHILPLTLLMRSMISLQKCRKIAC